MAVRVVLDREVAGYLGLPEEREMPVPDGAELVLADVVRFLEATGSAPYALRDQRDRELHGFVAATVNGLPVRRLDAKVQARDVVRLHLRFMEGG